MCARTNRKGNEAHDRRIASDGHYSKIDCGKASKRESFRLFHYNFVGINQSDEGLHICRALLYAILIVRQVDPL